MYMYIYIEFIQYHSYWWLYLSTAFQSPVLSATGPGPASLCMAKRKAEEVEQAREAKPPIG